MSSGNFEQSNYLIHGPKIGLLCHRVNVGQEIKIAWNLLKHILA